MSSMTAHPAQSLTRRSGRKQFPPRVRPPGRGSGRTVRPQLRPQRQWPTGAGRHRSAHRVRACAPEGTAAAWRLTDRGLAVVTVLIAMVVVAAVAVVALTAWQVTGESYAPLAHR